MLACLQYEPSAEKVLPLLELNWYELGLAEDPLHVMVDVIAYD